jgi:hypothetical protein
MQKQRVVKVKGQVGHVQMGTDRSVGSKIRLCGSRDQAAGTRRRGLVRSQLRHLELLRRNLESGI